MPAPCAGLARSLPDARCPMPDARDITDELTKKGIALNLGGSVYDPTDPIDRLLFNVLGMAAEFEADLLGARTRGGMAVAKAKGRLRGKQPTLSPAQERDIVDLYRKGAARRRRSLTSSKSPAPPVYRASERAGTAAP